jgi:hypothetical protein
MYRELLRRHEAAVGPSYAAVTCFNLGDHRPRADRRSGHQSRPGQWPGPQLRRPADRGGALRGADRGSRRY